MCINYQTSLVAFLIGELSGILLVFCNDSHSFESVLIGLFVMFYSLIQFFEMLIHKKKNSNSDSLYKKLLLINLGFQGLVFFILMRFSYSINPIYIIICIIISLYILYWSLTNDVEIEFNTTKCLEWKFMSEDNISNILGLMYLIMFFWIFTEVPNGFIKSSGYILLTTCIMSYFLTNTMINSPSIWCMSSAIIAPVLLLL